MKHVHIMSNKIGSISDCPEPLGIKRIYKELVFTFHSPLEKIKLNIGTEVNAIF